MALTILAKAADWFGYACAVLFILMACAGVTVGIFTHEPGRDSGPTVDRDGVPPAVEFGDGYGYEYERDYPR